MNLEEAKAVVAIMQTADGGCRGCVGQLLKSFVTRFPEFEVVQDGEFVEPYHEEVPGDSWDHLEEDSEVRLKEDVA